MFFSVQRFLLDFSLFLAPSLIPEPSIKGGRDSVKPAVEPLHVPQYVRRQLDSNR